MKKHLSTIIFVIVLFVGLSLLLYPTISDYWNSYHQSKAIASYNDTVDNMDEVERQKILTDAQEYNKRLLSNNDRFEMSDEEYSEYDTLLNINGNGIMGYVDIPRIDVSIPIYHGTDNEVLQIGVGHIEGTSLPIGGESTHSAISGHRGLTSSKLFTDIDQLSEGDVFMINVLGETLTYEVDQIRIVLPDELNDLKIETGMDYCTLVTCTPYGVNTHRLLIRGHRIPNEDAEALEIEDARQVSLLMETLGLGALILVVYIIIMKIMKNKVLKRFR